MKEPKRDVKIRHWIFSIITFFNMGAILLFLLIIFWSVYPYKPLEFKDKEFVVITKQVRQGGVLKYYSNYCKYMDLPARVSGTFANSIIYSVPTIHTNRETGCHKMIVQVVIPLELPVGKIHFQRVYEFKVNPIREVSVTHQTEVFEVIESTQAADLRLQGY